MTNFEAMSRSELLQSCAVLEAEIERKESAIASRWAHEIDRKIMGFPVVIDSTMPENQIRIGDQLFELPKEN